MNKKTNLQVNAVKPAKPKKPGDVNKKSYRKRYQKKNKYKYLKPAEKPEFPTCDCNFEILEDKGLHGEVRGLYCKDCFNLCDKCREYFIKLEKYEHDLKNPPKRKRRKKFHKK